MRRACLLLFTLIFAVAAAKAQDIITLTNGDKIRAKVLEINPGDIKYKDFNNQEGPTTTIPKNTVAEIRYSNGTKKVFEEEQEVVQPASSGVNRPRGGSFRREPREGHTHGHEQVYKRKPIKDAKLGGWYFGMNILLGQSSATNKDPNYSTASGSYTGLSLFATKMFNQHFGVQMGIGLEAFSYIVNYSPLSSSTYADDVFTLSTFQIPLRVLYFSNAKKRAGVYVMAGADVGFLSDARDEEQNNIKSIYNSVMITPYLSAGVEFRTRNAHGVWMFGPYYKSTMSNFYSTSSGNDGVLNSVGLCVEYMGKFGSHAGKTKR